MAKVKFSALISEMRNKLNGSVFSKNRGGNYLRNKVTPVNPQTVFQTVVRGYLTTLAQNWRGLTPAQRLSWASAVPNYQRTDIFGDIKTPSGINLYTRLGLNAFNSNAVPLSTAPVLGDTPDTPIAALTVTAGVQLFSVTSTLAAVPAGQRWVIRATANLSAGKNFVKSEYRNIAVLNAATALPFNGTAAYTAKFGPLIAGQKVGLEVIAIDQTSFVNSQAARDLEIVAP